jgi:hypothetical protein
MEKTLSVAEQEKQETLTVDIFKSLCVRGLVETTTRPPEHFQQVMKWVQNNFSKTICPQPNAKLEVIVNNRIVIDGQFLLYAKEVGAEVSCLYKDATVSWKTDSGSEKFFQQGVFLIKCNDELSFLQSALYLKGNSYEDEVCFFAAVKPSQLDQYLEFRNAYDAWVQKRDRSNQSIYVVGGEAQPYDPESSWDDVLLTEEVKTDIKSSVETFLASRDFYLKNKIPWKRGLIFAGPPGNGKTSTIKTIIAKYDFKSVTIQPGAPSEDLREAFKYAEEQSPSLLFFEDLDASFGTTMDPSLFLNLMDGVVAKNGIMVIATANNLNKLPDAVTRRPSRFDRIIKFDLPNAEMTKVYCKKWFGEVLSEKDLTRISKEVVKHKLSFAYLKDLYVSSMLTMVGENRTELLVTDIDKVLKRLISERNGIKSSGISTDIF